ncbi:MAG: hypothetical protein Q7U66_13685 [Methylobacter sp.]|nr:hypothetical protein [Methylobacter sp.]
MPKAHTPAGIKEPIPGKQDTSNTDTPKPTALQKLVKVIRAEALNTKTYLETEDEVDAYLAKLGKELLLALHEGKKARIQ